MKPAERIAVLFLCLVLIPDAALSQSSSKQIHNQTDLAVALTAANQEQRELAVNQLLEGNQRFVTPDLWHTLINLAEMSYYARAHERAFSIYEIAAKVAKKLNDNRLLAKTYYYIGRGYSGIEQFEQATQSYLESKKAFEEAGLRRDVIYILSDLGSLYLNLEDYEKAKSYSEQSITLAKQLQDSDVAPGAYPDQYSAADAFSTLGAICEWEGQYEQALNYLQQALTLLQQLGEIKDENSYKRSDILSAVGRIHRLMGDNLEALSHFNKALELVQHSSSPRMRASILNSIGVLYLEQEDYEKASEFFKQSLEINRVANHLIEVARVNFNIGLTRYRQRLNVKALERFQASLMAAEGSRNKELITLAEQMIGAVYQSQGESEKALEWLNKSLIRAEARHDRARIIEALWRQAEVLLAKGDHLKAITMGDRAADLAAKHNLPKHLYLSLTTLGKAHRVNKSYDRAFMVLKRAIVVVESLRTRVAGGDQSKQKFLENSIAPYHEMFLLLMEQNRIPEAFEYAERGKGRVLLDMLHDGKARVTKAMTADERSKEQKLNSEIINLNHSIMRENLRDEPDQTRLEELSARLERARLSYETFLTGLYTVHPGLRRLRGELPTVSTQELLSIIPDDKIAVLEYVVTKERTYLLVLTKKASPQGSGESRIDIRAYKLGVTTEELTKLVSEFRRQIAERRIIQESDYHRLYDLLLKPAEEQFVGKKTLCVVPDGVLWKLPFQSLRRDAKFLAEDYAFFYTPSLSVLREMTMRSPIAKNNRPASRALLAFANPSLGTDTVQKIELLRRGKKLAPLPEAEREVRTAARLFSPGQSKVYIGREALERRAKAEAGKHNVLHFATHGLLDDRNPMYSYLVLAQTDDTGEDGLLEAREIMNLDLRASLVVLSACETGLGRFSAGEGVIGIAWAFFVAGAPSTVASLWSVESASTSQLMIEFHRQLATSNNSEMSISAKAAALQKAQLKLLTSERFDHPFYWAGFSLYGDPR